MDTTTHLPPATVNLRNVLALTVLCLLAVISWLAAVSLGTHLAAERYPRLIISIDDFPLRTPTIFLAQVAFFGFCALLVRRTIPLGAAIRYGVKLQVQAVIEVLTLFVYGGLTALGIYGLAVLGGDTETPASMREAFTSGRAQLAMIVLALATPSLATIAASLRLHILSRRPGALAGIMDGSLLARTVVVRGEPVDCQGELVRHLERLTSSEMPGLGRVLYGSHPKLTTRREGNLSVHELVWWTCPMKLRVVLAPLDKGVLELQIRCLMRSGVYRLLLCATPADVVAEMQYIEMHLVRPFAARLEQAAMQRQHDALRDQAVEVQLRILQAQIEPHFLFNTLANVRQLYRTSHASGESMLDHLITYLRCAMDDLRADYSSVVKEMDLAMHYLAIMQIRMGERLAYRFSVPAVLLEHPMPPAMLISLVENSIKHGLANASRGEIVLSAASDGTSLRVSVADNGAGISSVGGTGVGLSNIRQRLEALYGSQAWLEVGAPLEGGFVATIVIPLEERK